MYLNIVQLAESLGVAERDIEDWIRHDDLPAIADRGRWLFDRAQVAEWASRRGMAARAGHLTMPPAQATCRLDELLAVGGVWRGVAAAEVRGVLETVVGRLPGVGPAIIELLQKRVSAPGGLNWAPIGGGLALPHFRERIALGRRSGLLAVLLLREELQLEEAPPDGVPLTRLMFFAAPSPQAHLEILARLSQALTQGALRQCLEAGTEDEAIFAALRAAQAKGGSP